MSTIEETFTDAERQLLLGVIVRLAAGQVIAPTDGPIMLQLPALLSIAAKMSGVDTTLIARRAYRSQAAEPSEDPP